MDGLLASSMGTLRLISGWACCSLGLLGLAMGIDTGPGTTDGSYLLFHAVLLLAGVVLFLTRRPPSRPSYAVGAAIALLGFLASALPETEIVCCLLEYPTRHGYPFTFLARGGGTWHFSPGHVATDVLFWLCAGLFALATTELLTRRRPVPQPIHQPTHAEHRAAAQHDSEKPKHDGEKHKHEGEKHKHESQPGRHVR